VSFVGVAVKVDAKGYVSSLDALEDKLGTAGWSLFGDPPPPILIQLTPKKR
jgi:hypothetical protein